MTLPHFLPFFFFRLIPPPYNHAFLTFLFLSLSALLSLSLSLTSLSSQRCSSLLLIFIISPCPHRCPSTPQPHRVPKVRQRNISHPTLAHLHLHDRPFPPLIEFFSSLFLSLSQSRPTINPLPTRHFLRRPTVSIPARPNSHFRWRPCDLELTTSHSPLADTSPCPSSQPAIALCDRQVRLLV